MTGRAILRLSPIALLVAAAACGGGGGTKTTTVTQTVTVTSPNATTPTPAGTSLRVYFLLNGKVQPVSRTVPKTKAVAAAALGMLVASGPSSLEKAAMPGLSTEVSAESSWRVDRSGGALTVHGAAPSGAALAQLVFTMTQFSNSTAVDVGGKRYTRADFEDFAPAILVERPLPFQAVESPFRIAGTANTFEATFQYKLEDEPGHVLARHFATATSGSGTRGTFDITIPFHVTKAGRGRLIVYEDSAANGQPIHQVSIPLWLEP
jgi:immunoglobulin-like protein involved in spore germination/sporulation and spore germination protein